LEVSTVTLHISDKTQRLLLDEAQRQHISPEELAEKLIQRGLSPKRRDLSHLAGTWTDEEVEAFEESVSSLQQVTEEDSA
jgi:hypothetical protein